MTDAINTNNRLKVPSQSVEPRSKSTAKGSSEASASAPSSTVVELSSDQLMKEVQQLPAVDSKRIESIKAAIANGEYQSNAEVIARKFSEIEQLLP
jgi:negative regulator of flagellin synthesis FlgM